MKTILLLTLFAIVCVKVSAQTRNDYNFSILAIDESGQYLEGVTILIKGIPIPDKTNSTGLVILRGLTTEVPYLLTALKEGYIPIEFAIQVNDKNPIFNVKTITLKKDIPRIFTGGVYQCGKPIESIKVVINIQGTEHSATTTENGVYRIVINEKELNNSTNFEIIARNLDGTVFRESLTVPIVGTVQHDITFECLPIIDTLMPPPDIRIIKFEVTDKRTNRPVSGANIKVREIAGNQATNNKGIATFKVPNNQIDFIRYKIDRKCYKRKKDGQELTYKTSTIPIQVQLPKRRCPPQLILTTICVGGLSAGLATWSNFECEKLKSSVDNIKNATNYDDYMKFKGEYESAKKRKNIATYSSIGTGVIFLGLLTCDLWFNPCYPAWKIQKKDVTSTGDMFKKSDPILALKPAYGILGAAANITF